MPWSRLANLLDQENKRLALQKPKPSKYTTLKVSTGEGMYRKVPLK